VNLFNYRLEDVGCLNWRNLAFNELKKAASANLNDNDQQFPVEGNLTNYQLSFFYDSPYLYRFDRTLLN
jgi:hypothetical protein